MYVGLSMATSGMVNAVEIFPLHVIIVKILCSVPQVKQILKFLIQK